jgi:hypothetical protein
VTTQGSYYYAGGRRIPLFPVGEVVLDRDSDAGRRADALHGTPLTPSLVLLPEAEAVAALGEAFATSPGVHPVFRTEDGSRVAVLPQVRVEGSAETLDDLGRAATSARIAQRTEDRLVLEPASGRGEDALALANDLAERGGAEVCQARFLRLVKRPGV